MACLCLKFILHVKKVKQDVFVKHKCLIMANSKDGKGHKYTYLDTSRGKTHVHYESSNIYFKNNETTEKSYYKEYSCEIYIIDMMLVIHEFDSVE